MDTDLLDWMIFHSARVCHSVDGEVCWVVWTDDPDTGEQRTDGSGDAREEIAQAMKGK